MYLHNISNRLFSSGTRQNPSFETERASARDRCYDFLNIFAEKFSEKIGVFDSKQS
jgi:hypothetical protein